MISNRMARETMPSGSRLVFGRAAEEWDMRVKWWKISRKMDRNARSQARQLNELLGQERRLRRQQASIVFSRRMLGMWHAVHIPVGMVLFAAAIIHIVAAIYYATLLH
ncbi:MAG: hypothetical protein ACM3H7_04775, partial [Acidobacteriaceae bacterium]